MKYLHTMVRVTDLEKSLQFYCEALGLREISRRDVPAGRFTLIFLAAPGDESAQQEDAQPDESESQQQAEAQANLDQQMSEQAEQQWLRKIPDDPGGLLRRKFLYQYRQRDGVQTEEESW